MRSGIIRGLCLATSLLLVACSERPVSVEQVANEYVRLVLALGQHDADYVDAYYGPQNLADKAAESSMSSRQIAEEAVLLRQQLLDISVHQKQDADQRLRLHYLEKQLLALTAYATSLADGEKQRFDRQSRDLYDTEAPHKQLADFDASLAELNALLPGDGSLTERVVAFRKQFTIPADKLEVVFQRAITECRERTRHYIQLPEQENFTLEFVQDKPWSGYNWYKGNAFSLIQINTERPIDISRAVDLGCHEGYPGHHTYNALLEQKLVKEKGWQEFSVYPLFSPQSLIAEGTANYGIELAFPGKEKMEFERDVLFPLAGLNPAMAEDYAHFLQLLATLSYAGNEVARLYLDKQIDDDKAVALLQQYTLSSEAEARQRVRFFNSYGAYVINYNWGKDLVKSFVEQTDDQQERWNRFIRLISSPRVPSSLSWE